MINITEEKLTSIMFKIWHDSNNLPNPVVAGDYIQKEIEKINQGQTLPIDNVVSSAMYKATFSFKKSSPRGGTPYWTTEIVPLEAKNETELKEKIATYQENDHNSYHEHIKLTSIELM